MVQPYKRFQSQGYVKIVYRCYKFNAYGLLSCRGTSTLSVFLCHATVTFHQGQGHRHKYVYAMPTPTVMASLNAIAEIVPEIKVRVKTFVNFETRL